MTVDIIEPQYDDATACFFCGLALHFERTDCMLVFQVAPIIQVKAGIDPDNECRMFEFVVQAIAGISICIMEAGDDD